MRTITIPTLLSTLLMSSAFAQADRGTVTGTVTDPNGAPIPDASVTATHLGTNSRYKAATTDGGAFTLADVPVGEYHVIIEIEGFKSATYESARIDAGGTVRLDTKLEVGSVRQSIEVSTENSLLQTDDAKMQNEISDRLIEGLPTVVSGNLRSPFDLAGITAK